MNDQSNNLLPGRGRPGMVLGRIISTRGRLMTVIGEEETMAEPASSVAVIRALYDAAWV